MHENENASAGKALAEPELKRIRLQPSTPTDNGAFALAGGGNSPHRIGLKAVSTKYPQMVARYRVVRSAGGIECVQAEE